MPTHLAAKPRQVVASEEVDPLRAPRDLAGLFAVTPEDDVAHPSQLGGTSIPVEAARRSAARGNVSGSKLLDGSIDAEVVIHSQLRVVPAPKVCRDFSKRAIEGRE